MVKIFIFLFQQYVIITIQNKMIVVPRHKIVKMIFCCMALSKTWLMGFNSQIQEFQCLTRIAYLYLQYLGFAVFKTLKCYKFLPLLQLPVHGILIQHLCSLLHSQWQNYAHMYVRIFLHFTNCMTMSFFLLDTPDIIDEGLQSSGISETSIIYLTKADMNATM